MKKVLVLAAAAMFALPALASAQIVGDCADCHTMHNSEQGQAVAVWGLDTEAKGHTFPIQNLLRMDCIACHAQDTTKTVTLDGGSVVPQVYHSDAAGNLAGGNFKYVAELGDRKGHNVRDLMAADVENSNNPRAFAAGATLAPGDIRNDEGGHDFTNFTCAGAKGCHGTRSQALDSYDDGSGTANITIERVGIAAVSGAHHNNYEGLKNPTQIADVVGAGAHSGEELADSYRFLRGLKGWGNEAVRWENVDSTSHNEYFGVSGGIGGVGTGCNRCHVPGDMGANGGRSARFTTDSSLRIPNQSMSGFCSTCHGNFHSSGMGGDLVGGNYGPSNGVSGAFLRHPSDYVIPARGEYNNYKTYDVTAPVARQTLAASSSVVTPGTDMVMCLSCHVAHGSEHDGMLRFDYARLGSAMTAGSYDTIADAQQAGGCLACHTTKGVQNTITGRN